MYQCLFLALVSLMVTFIFVNAHVSSAIHLVCCQIEPSIASASYHTVNMVFSVT